MKCLRVLAFACLWVSAGSSSAEGLSLEFSSETPEFSGPMHEYAEIWRVEGVRIEEALERATGVSLGDQQISVVVFEGTSSSGSTGAPMYLRASYSEAVKRATLVHELAHRYLDTLNLRESCFDDIHQVLSLVVLEVWVELWGREFAEEQAGIEVARSERYKRAWSGVLEASPSKNSRKLKSFLSSCRTPN